MREANSKILALTEAIEVIRQWKSKEEKLVFTNGCFDLIHLGHVDYLEKARLLGDRLIVGVNTDHSITRLKGPSRPITNQNSRLRVLAALECVDCVIPFDHDTPIQLIEQIRPNLLVKGDDYDAKETNPASAKYIVGSDIVLGYGGNIDTVQLVHGYSTSSIIKKIQDQG